jgi:hypothetical protein
MRVLLVLVPGSNSIHSKVVEVFTIRATATVHPTPFTLMYTYIKYHTVFVKNLSLHPTLQSDQQSHN